MMETVTALEKMIINRFGILLAEKRIKEKRNISLGEVSQVTGIPRKTLFAWSNNTVTRYDEHVLDALCKYFECKLGELLEWQHAGSVAAEMLDGQQSQDDGDYTEDELPER